MTFGKAKVEVGVQVVERWIIAALRHQKFFRLEEVSDSGTVSTSFHFQCSAAATRQRKFPMNSNEEVKPLLTSDTTEVSLLPAEVIERIRAKEMAQVAAREERRQKKSEAEKLAAAASVKNCAKSRRPPHSGAAT